MNAIPAELFDWSQNAPSHLFYQTGGRRPFIERAEGVYIWDAQGRRFLDGSSGAMVSNIGHGNKRVLDAMRDQMNATTFGYRLHFENEPAERLASVLSKLSPQGLDRVFFASGGSEAVESCIKLARQYALAKGETKRTEVISRFPSYHGSTFGALAVTGYGPLNDPFAPMVREMPKIPAPRAYLDRDNSSDEARGLRYADMLRGKIEELGPENVLAFIMEPVGGASTGALVAPDSYYQRVRDICDDYGVLLIYDEVMTGVGRTGTFLAAEHWGQSPDIIALSKGLGAGYVPLGAMIARRDIVDPVVANGGFMHGYTYAGNPLACAAGLAVIREIYEQDLMANTARIGALLKSRLDNLTARFPFIGDVRGKGLLLAFELVANRETMTPLPKDANAFAKLVEYAYEEQLIIYSRRTHGGYEGDHFLVCPPMIATESHVDEIMEKLTKSLDRLAGELKLPVNG
ncbi:aspartate aminotransferase family protein [Hyphococcus luteus]|uniref:Aspartate aminotransferase family protein n=1 Tax=Hyphococcus luteus TaxID=2058213 RepID=A0A2S7KA36_9PROT|nr:aspartate aminotransferase family protein [Marinicaulis flavus]PQA89343.1 aspartate aminotransferase family protein [Marinicaulis flavus]